MNAAHPPPVGRLAPSPTGALHLGHARTFLVAWWHARARGGAVELRIEDLDRERVKPGAVETCLRDLEWLGLDWDGAPLLQSADTGPLEAALARLLAEGRAYRCSCSRRDVENALSAPHAGQGEPRYPGTCRARRVEARAGGATPGVRLAVPAGPVELVDGIAGPFTHDVQSEVGDFLVTRRGGGFAYQLAVVVDDARAGVTEVVRGDDLLPSTTRQWHVQRALGLAHPAWFHVPLVLDENGGRLAKRSGSPALSELRAAGVDARALVGWAARSAGQRVEERVSAREVAERFELALLPRSPVRVGPAVLDALRRAR